MTTSEKFGTLAAALAKAQGEMAGAQKDSVNPHFRARYASLAAVWDACREPLSKNALSVLQPVRADGARVTVTTILAHDSGEWISEELTVTAQSPTPQGVGSAITYGRRYGLSAMVGIAPDDDDGEDASHSNQAHQVAVDALTNELPEEASTARPRTAAAAAPKAPPASAASRPSPPAQRSAQSGNGADLVISEAQAKRFHAIANGAGWRTDELKNWLHEVWHVESSRDIPRAKYDDICKQVEQGIGG
jgi:hypothetical protein